MFKGQLKMATAIATILLATSSPAAPTVTDLTARQRYPWNGLVDISFTLSERGYISVFATNAATGAVVPVRTLRDKAGNADGGYTEFAPGNVHLVWDAGTDVPETLIETLSLSVVGAQPRGGVQLWAGGPYWAETNVGAEKPEDYGLYFWWGDTIGYRREGNAWVASDGSSQNFSFGSGNTPTYGKSNSALQSEGWITSSGVLTQEHDAAYVHWGGPWRIPTFWDLSNLDSKCDWTWTTRNGVNGYVVRGRGDFVASSIFLPAVGYGDGASLHSAGSYGAYWSSFPIDNDYNRAWSFYFGSNYHDTSFYNHRNYGLPVRPVQRFAQ